MLPLGKAIDSADMVITGKVLSRDRFTKKDGMLTEYISTNVKYKILVIKKHKGKTINNIQTIVTGPNDGGDCGYPFELGKTYTIYAHIYPVIVKGKKVNQFFQTSICTRTNQFSKSEMTRIDKYCKNKGSS